MNLDGWSDIMTTLKVIGVESTGRRHTLFESAPGILLGSIQSAAGFVRRSFDLLAATTQMEEARLGGSNTIPGANSSKLTSDAAFAKRETSALM